MPSAGLSSDNVQHGPFLFKMQAIPVETTDTDTFDKILGRQTEWYAPFSSVADDGNYFTRRIDRVHRDTAVSGLHLGNKVLFSEKSLVYPV